MTSRITGTKENAPGFAGSVVLFWLRGQDSNLRPLGYEPNELPLLHPAALRYRILYKRVEMWVKSSGY